MIQTHDRWWQLLHDAGLLDNAEAKFQDASTVKRIHVSGKGRSAVYGYAFPRIGIQTFRRLIERIEDGATNQPTLDRLAACYTIGIATPVVAELANFCRTYSTSDDPDKEKHLKLMLTQLKEYTDSMERFSFPYPYFNDVNWQLAMQADFETIELLRRGRNRMKVPEGFPCIVRLRRQPEGGAYRVSSACIYVNGKALPFTVPWLHKRSKNLPQEFNLPCLKSDTFALFGVVNATEAELHTIYTIGQELKPCEIIPSDDIASVQKWLHVNKAVYARALTLPKHVKAIAFVAKYKGKEANLKRLKEEFDSNCVLSKLFFYPLDVLICKGGEQTRTMNVEYTKILDKVIKPIRPNIELSAYIEFSDTKADRKWQI